MEGLGGPEMFLVFVIILMLFGGQKLPEFARGLGKTMREFKKAASGVEDEFKRALEEDERKKTAAAYVPPATTPSLLPPGPTDETMVAAAATATTEPAAAPPAEPESVSMDAIPAPPLIPGPFASANYDEYGESPASSVAPTPAAPPAPAEPPPELPAGPSTNPLAAVEKRPDPPA
ncbi:MAG: twin-arginine translocase TatA/TatE family subunit [Opitutus sp.]|nr:twin-arginine translocase TatA/TatE family subunit [Opitutus sp.]